MINENSMEILLQFITTFRTKYIIHQKYNLVQFVLIGGAVTHVRMYSVLSQITLIKQSEFLNETSWHTGTPLQYSV